MKGDSDKGGTFCEDQQGEYCQWVRDWVPCQAEEHCQGGESGGEPCFPLFLCPPPLTLPHIPVPHKACWPQVAPATPVPLGTARSARGMETLQPHGAGGPLDAADPSRGSRVRIRRPRPPLGTARRLLPIPTPLHTPRSKTQLSSQKGVASFCELCRISIRVPIPRWGHRQPAAIVPVGCVCVRACATRVPASPPLVVGGEDAAAGGVVAVLGLPQAGGPPLLLAVGRAGRHGAAGAGRDAQPGDAALMSASCENGHRHRLKAPGSAAPAEPHGLGDARPPGFRATHPRGSPPTHPSSSRKERMEEEDFLPQKHWGLQPCRGSLGA